MRWKYIIPRAVLLTGIWAFFTFAFDLLLKRELISVGEQAASAKVDIAAAKTGLFPPRLEVEKLRVANHNEPGTNLVEFDSLTLNVAGGPLLKKLFIVNEGTLTGLRWGTKREDSGLLPETPEQKAERESAEKEGGDEKSTLAGDLQSRGKQFLAGLTDRGKLELDPQQFESIRLGIELEKRWTGEFAKLKGEADELTRQVETIERQVKTDSDNKLERLEAYREAAGNSTKALEEIKQLKAELDAQAKQARVDFTALGQAQKHDREAIRTKIDLFKTDPQQLTEILLGPELNHRMHQALDWIATGRRWFQRRQQQKALTQRMRGEVIAFARNPNLPEFLVKLLNIEGAATVEGQPLALTGTLSGLTSDPVVHGEPAILRLEGKGEADLDLKVVFDYTEADREPTHEVLLSYSTPHPAALKLGDDSSLRVDVSAEKLTCRAELRLIGEEISGKIHFHQEPAKLEAKLGGKAGQIDPRIATAVTDVFGGVHELDAEMEISGKLKTPEWSLKSNLGHEVAGGLSAAVSKQLEGERDALAKKLDEQLTSQKTRLQDLFKTQTQGLTAQLNSYEQQLKELAQKATGARLADLDNVAGKALNKVIKPQDPKKSVLPIDFSKEEEKAKEGLKKLFKK